mmetsp:Transcript_56082/g.131431  ORF Transcript_56082/g.131431 Transcript_56082/m.131431 type:complete len:219 (-) Transcript_56082:203-859(-)
MTMGIFWFWRKSSIHSMLSRSKWFVGSSRRRMLGSVRRILPRPILIFQPPLKEATRASASSDWKPIRSIIFSTLESSRLMPFCSTMFWSSAIRSSASCIALGSSVHLASTSSMPSSSLRISASSVKTLIISSLSVRDGTSSSTNSWRRNAILRSSADLMMSPLSGSSSPYKILSWVVLPPPLAPTNPTRSPDWTPQVASVSTSWFLKVIAIFSIRKDT